MSLEQIKRVDYTVKQGAPGEAPLLEVKFGSGEVNGGIRVDEISDGTSGALAKVIAFPSVDDGSNERLNALACAIAAVAVKSPAVARFDVPSSTVNRGDDDVVVDITKYGSDRNLSLLTRSVLAEAYNSPDKAS